MFVLTALSAILATLPTPEVRLSYDALAYSEVYHSRGDLHFCQIGGLDWICEADECGEYSTLRWQWWRIVDGPQRCPIRRDGQYVATWRDTKDRCRYRVTAPVLHVWRTVNDPEVDDRSGFPEAYRRGLR